MLLSIFTCKVVHDYTNLKQTLGGLIWFLNEFKIEVGWYEKDSPLR